MDQPLKPFAVILGIIALGALSWAAFVGIYKTQDETVSRGAATTTPIVVSPKIILQEMVLGDGSRVFLVAAHSVGENAKFNRTFNCTLPEIEMVDAALEYEGVVTPLGFIGVPKKTGDHFPVIQNTIDYGLANVEKTLEWAPLQKLAHGFGMIDYSRVMPVDPKSTSAVQSSWEACHLRYQMQFFEVDQTTKALRLRDSNNGENLYDDLERFKKDITPGCSPFGCG